MMPVQTDGPEDYKAKYKTLKRKLKLLIYENECFQEELRKAQRALLRVRRDKSFLLDRLLQYQRGPDSSSDSEQTEESDAEMETKVEHKSCRKRLSMEGSAGGSSSSQSVPSKPPSKKKKTSNSSGGGGGGGGGGGSSGGGGSVGGGGGGGSSNNSSSLTKPSKQSGKQIPPGVGPGGNSSSGGAGGTLATTTTTTTTTTAGAAPTTAPTSTSIRKLAPSHLAAASVHHQGVQGRRGMGGPGGAGVVAHTSDGQLSREEVERRLAARQSMTDFTTTTVSLTLPNQLFSDNIMEGDFMEEEVETSPSNMEDDVTVDNYD